jgi:hypothetical protein
MKTAEVDFDDRRYRKTPYTPKKKERICSVCKCRPVPKGPIRGCILTRMCEVCWSEGLAIHEDECFPYFFDRSKEK